MTLSAQRKEARRKEIKDEGGRAARHAVNDNNNFIHERHSEAHGLRQFLRQQ